MVVSSAAKLGGLVELRQDLTNHRGLACQKLDDPISTRRPDVLVVRYDFADASEDLLCPREQHRRPGVDLCGALSNGTDRVHGRRDPPLRELGQSRVPAERNNRVAKFPGSAFDGLGCVFDDLAPISTGPADIGLPQLLCHDRLSRRGALGPANRPNRYQDLTTRENESGQRCSCSPVDWVGPGHLGSALTPCEAGKDGGQVMPQLAPAGAWRHEEQRLHHDAGSALKFLRRGQRVDWASHSCGRTNNRLKRLPKLSDGGLRLGHSSDERGVRQSCGVEREKPRLNLREARIVDNSLSDAPLHCPMSHCVLAVHEVDGLAGVTDEGVRGRSGRPVASPLTAAGRVALLEGQSQGDHCAGELRPGRLPFVGIHRLQQIQPPVHTGHAAPIPGQAPP